MSLLPPNRRALMSQSDERFQPTDSVVYTRLDDTEVVLLHLYTQHYYRLNMTGARIWEHLAAGSDPEMTAKAISQEFDIEPAEAHEDVMDLLGDLQEEELIEPRREATL